VQPGDIVTPDAGPVPAEDRPTAARRERVARAFAAVAGAILLVGATALALAVDKGLDLTDEGFSLLTERFPTRYMRLSTQAQLIWAPVLDLVGSVAALRFTRLVLLLAAAGFLAWEVVRIPPGIRSPAARWALGLSVTAGAFAPAVWLPQSPGYNDLTVIAVLVLVALTLAMLPNGVDAGAPGRFAPYRSQVQAVCWGVAWWVLLLAKWPAAIVMVALSVATLATWQRSEVARLVRQVVWAAAGVAGAALVTQLFLAPLGDIVDGVRRSTNDLSNTHGTGRLLPTYLRDLSSVPKELVTQRWWLLLVAVAIGALLGRKSTGAIGRVALSTATWAYVLAAAAMGKADGGAPNLWIFSRLLPELACLLLICLAVACALDSHRLRALSGPTVRAVLLLGVVPLAAALGTGNAIWYNAETLSACWIAGLGVLLVALVGDEVVAVAVTSALAALVAFGAVTGTWLHPYRQVPLREASAEIASGPAAGLTVDPELARLVGSTQAVAGPGAAPSIIVIWKRPGLVYAAGGLQPEFAWVPRENPERAAASLEGACQDRSRAVVLASEERTLPNEVQAVLQGPTCSVRSFVSERPLPLPHGGSLRVLRAPAEE
jgi:hypothetical protein